MVESALERSEAQPGVVPTRERRQSCSFMYGLVQGPGSLAAGVEVRLEAAIQEPFCSHVPRSTSQMWVINTAILVGSASGTSFFFLEVVVYLFIFKAVRCSKVQFI